MKKKSSIAKITVISVFLVIGILLSCLSFGIPFNNYKYVSFAKAIQLGAEFEGSAYTVYDIDNDGISDYDSKLSDTRKNLEKYLREQGYSDAGVVVESDNSLRADVVGSDVKTVLEAVGSPAEFQFFVSGSTDTPVFTIDAGSLDQAIGYYSSGTAYVYVDLTDEKAEEFETVSSDNSGSTLDIYAVVDGTKEDTAIASASISESISGGVFQIPLTNESTAVGAQAVAMRMLSQSLDLKLSVADSQSVSATFGDKALLLGTIALGSAIAVACVFMAIRYRLFGLSAFMSFLTYAILMLFFMAALPWFKLTSGAVAGIMITLILLFDGNITLYERIKKEYGGGKSILASLNSSFKRTAFTVLDVSVVFMLAGAALIFFGFTRSFGIALALGSLINLVTFVVITRALVRSFTRLNSTNGKVYALKRDEGVEEPDFETEGA